MCGRFYSPSQEDELIARLMRSLPAGERGLAGGEVSPDDGALVITAFGARGMRWGYRLQGKDSLIINARSETLDERRAFRGSSRCVIPAECYFEWFGTGRARTKYKMWRGRETLFMAGIYKIFDGAPRFAVLTREACPSIRALHDRMPVLIARGDIKKHLEGGETSPLDCVESDRADGQMSLFGGWE